MVKVVAPSQKARKTSPRPTAKGKRNSVQSQVWKEIWADPERREALLAKRRAAPVQRGKRTGVPDGMRKADAEAAWARAAEQADRFIKIMEKAGEIPEVVVPGSEAEMAKEVLREAYKDAVSPMTDKKVKATYQRLVLDFTKAKPESRSKLTLDKSEEWLAALEEDMNADGRSSSDPQAAT